VEHTELIKGECARLGLVFVDMAGDAPVAERRAGAGTRGRLP